MKYLIEIDGKKKRVKAKEYLLYRADNLQEIKDALQRIETTLNQSSNQSTNQATKNSDDTTNKSMNKLLR